MAPIRIAMRRSVVEDQKRVSALITKGGGSSKYRKRFGVFNAALLDSSYLSVVAYNADEPDTALLGFASFSDVPCEAATTEEWLAEANEGLGQRWQPQSVLWQTFLVADPNPGVEKRAVEALMRTAFSVLPHVGFVLFSLPLKEDRPNEMAHHFRKTALPEGSAVLPGAKSEEHLFVCEREVVIPTLAIRPAVVEDCDDLNPIFDSQADALRETYGDYFLAELVTAQDGVSSQTLVAEANGKVVGLMAVSSEVGLSSLQRSFSLAPFGYLAKGVPPGLNPKTRTSRLVNQNQNQNQRQFADGEGKEGDGGEGEGKEDGQGDDGSRSARATAELRATGEETKEAEAGEGSVGGVGVGTGEEEAKEGESKGAELGDSDDRSRRNTKQQEEEEEKDGGRGYSESGAERKESDDHNNHNNGGGGGGGGVDDGSSESEFFDALARFKSNAFAVTMLCVDGQFECRSHDFLPAAFEQFPDKQYAVLTVPTTVLTEPALVRGHTAVPPLPGTSFSHTLFVVHRDSLLAEKHLKVTRYCPTLASSSGASPAQRALAASVNRTLLDKLPKGSRVQEAMALVAQEDEFPLKENPGRVCFVASIGVSGVVGLVVVDRTSLSSERVNFLKANFNVDDHVDMSRVRTKTQAVVTAFYMDPVFHANARFLLKEAMRQYDKNLFYFESEELPAPFSALAGAPASPAASSSTGGGDDDDGSGGEEGSPPPREYKPPPPRLVLQHMVPARPRKRAQAQPEETQGRVDDEGRSLPSQPHSMRDSTTPHGFALHVLSKAMLSQPKQVVHSRVVVVGSSPTASAFLEAFLLVPHLFFTNVTLLSPDGLPSAVRETSGGGGVVASLVVVDEDSPTSTHLNALHLQRRCRVLKASVKELDRSAKLVVLALAASTSTATSTMVLGSGGGGGGLLPYDSLVVVDQLVDSTPVALSGGQAVTELTDALTAQGVAHGLDDEFCAPVLSLTSFQGAAKAPSGGGDIHQQEEEAAVSVVELDSRVKALLTDLKLIKKSGGGRQLQDEGDEEEKGREVDDEEGKQREEEEEEGVVPGNGEVIVYGSTLQCAAAVRGLLDFGLDPGRLTFVRPGWGPRHQPYADPTTAAASASLRLRREKERPEEDNGSNSGGGGGSGGGGSPPDGADGAEGDGGGGNKTSAAARNAQSSLGPLGNDRAEALLSASLQALGVRDRSDLTLVGVRGCVMKHARAQQQALNGGGGGGESKHGEEDRSTGYQSSCASSRSSTYSNAGGSGGGGGGGSKQGEEAKEGNGEEAALALSEVARSNNNDNADGGGGGDGDGDGWEVCPLETCVFERRLAHDSSHNNSTIEELPCSLLLSCHGLDVRPGLFRALNGSGLAYDGRLVVDPLTMATSDPCVFAGGDLTKFSRKYHAASHYHSFVNPNEMGCYLAAKVLDVCDPSVQVLKRAQSVSQAFSNAELEKKLAKDKEKANDALRKAQAAQASLQGSVASSCGGGGGGGDFGGESKEGGQEQGGQGQVSGQPFPLPGVFHKPRTVSCRLPGGYEFVRSATANALDPKTEIVMSSSASPPPPSPLAQGVKSRVSTRGGEEKGGDGDDDDDDEENRSSNGQGSASGGTSGDTSGEQGQGLLQAVVVPTSTSVATVLPTGYGVGSSATSVDPTCDGSCVLKLDLHGRVVELSVLALRSRAHTASPNTLTAAEGEEGGGGSSSEGSGSGFAVCEPRNLAKVVGLHAAMLQGCAARYRDGLVGDWVSYLRQAWCQALYHDRFEALVHDQLRARLRTDDAAKDVLELMRRALDDGKDDEHLTTTLTNAVGGNGERLTPGTAKRVDILSVDWLRENSALLPHYKPPDRKD